MYNFNFKLIIEINIIQNKKYFLCIWCKMYNKDIYIYKNDDLFNFLLNFTGSV
jgi:hypothetical protein